MLLATLLVLAVAAVIFAFTQIGALITLLFVVAVLVLAYKRLPLLSFSIVFTVAVRRLQLLVGEPGGTVEGSAAADAGGDVAVQPPAAAQGADLAAVPEGLPAHAADHVRHRARCAGSRRRVVGRRAVHRQARLGQAARDTPPARLTPEEQAFIDGPVEQLCALVEDFDVTHRRADLPPEAWEFIKRERFWAMIIPKQYGGLELGRYAQSSALTKLSSRSITLGVTVMVPNSLGPGELLVHYGTEEQKNHYLPRLARGEEIPCFGLTSPVAGSDAASITDTGIVCRGIYEGREVIGIRLSFSKRYITLAPIATVIGLAFRLFDPEHLIGDVEDVGITCALIPRGTPGILIGRRHFPLNIPFQNGPIQGENVFVPVDFIIGGPGAWRAGAGACWSSSSRSAAASRCRPMPPAARWWPPGPPAPMRASASSSGLSVGKFEGVEQVIARIVGNTYIMDAARSVTTGALDAGEKPAVPSAILKMHLTELSRKVGADAMDVHGGKGIMLGPRNYLGRGWQAAPIGITVEGANILTRNLIIFGQGAIRCHPFVLKEMEAARSPQGERSVDDFDRALFGHIGFTISNAVRSLVMAVTLARFESTPGSGPIRRYYQHIERFSASFAFATDVAMLSLGGYLKKKESLSARLGDVLSYLYLASMVLKHHHDHGSPKEDQPIVEWACRDLLYRAQEQLHGFLRNFPNRLLAWLMRALIFPRGRTYFSPSDRLGRAAGPARHGARPLARPAVPPCLPRPAARQSAGAAGRGAAAVRRPPSRWSASCAWKA